MNSESLFHGRLGSFDDGRSFRDENRHLRQVWLRLLGINGDTTKFRRGDFGRKETLFKNDDALVYLVFGRQTAFRALLVQPARFRDGNVDITTATVDLKKSTVYPETTDTNVCQQRSELRKVRSELGKSSTLNG
jgi:hypothetical protein